MPALQLLAGLCLSRPQRGERFFPLPGYAYGGVVPGTAAPSWPLVKEEKKMAHCSMPMHAPCVTLHAPPWRS